MKLSIHCLAVGLAFGLLTTAAYSADVASPAQEAKEFGLGDPAPEWKDLMGVDDQKHSFKDLADAKAVAVVFTCNHCPVAQAYEDRIIELAGDYQDKGVKFVAINVNNLDQDKLPAMKTRAEEKDYQFPYLYDPSQKIGRAFGATVTPHAFLFDGKHKLAYVGAIDDNMEADKVEQQYLREAIDAVLAGKEPETASTKPVGCGIQYE